jgi:hypothetical protein
MAIVHICATMKGSSHNIGLKNRILTSLQLLTTCKLCHNNIIHANIKA